MCRMSTFLCLFLAPVVLSSNLQTNEGVNPMRKIIGMLQDMQKEVEREGEVEKELFEKALCACDGGEKDLDATIATSSAAVEEYTAKVGSEKAETAQLTQEVADHKANGAQAEQDLGSATNLREKEHGQFVKKEKDTKLNLANLDKAIFAVEKGMGGAALVQLPKFNRFVEVTHLLSSEERTNVLAFLDQGEDSTSEVTVQAPQSGEIVGILKHLQDSMSSDLAAMQDQEKQDFEAFNQLKAAKTEEIKLAKDSIVTKEKRIGTLAVSLSESSHALEDAQEELADAQNFKSNLAEQCATKMKERDERAKMRAAEVAAISEAIKILNDDDALEVFKKTALVQKPQKTTYDALLQIRTSSAIASSAKSQTLLSIRQPEGTPPPMQLGAAIIRTADGGVKDLRKEGTESQKFVTHMIDGMIAVLHDDDVNDEHKKDWCANETAITHEIEASKKALIQQTSAEIEQLEDDHATLSAELKDLMAKIADTDKFVHEATEQRKTEHQEFVDAFATSSTAVHLITKAIARLEKFYSPQKYKQEKKGAEDAAFKSAGLALIHKDASPTPKSNRMLSALLPGGFDFIQVKAHKFSMRNGVDPLAIPDTPKTYEKTESAGVMGLMHDFMVDLKTDMTEAETGEKLAAKDYVRIMTDAQNSRAQLVKSSNMKKSEIAEVQEKLVNSKALLAKTDEELQNTQLYLMQLHTECDFLIRNFELRHAGRVESETGLNAAEIIVSDGEAPTHAAIEERFDSEHSAADIDFHFAGTPIVDGNDFERPDPEAAAAAAAQAVAADFGR